ncbi:MAG: hypothetical protein PHT16_01790 [Candidatus Pacebacteria bacterium]|nr:hypothetical protein [Candidatus Paceibacterota bacterium]
MITPELQTYIRQQLRAGVAKDTIRQNLSVNGWNSQDLDEAFLSIENPQSSQIVTSSVVSFGHKMMLIIVIVFLLFVGVGGAFAAYHYGLFNKLFFPTTAQLPVNATTENSTPITNTENAIATPQAETANTVCDNYQCLIAAASKCQPISVTISYSGVPFPLDPNVSMSGQNKYEIKKSSGMNDCSLTFSYLAVHFSISDKGRKAELASGKITDAQINAQLQTMNDSFKSTAGMQTTCLSSTNAIVDYLTDAMTNMKNGSFSFDVSSDLKGNTTYTTKSGQKLVCTDTSPKQPANTSVTITYAKCVAQKGSSKAITDAGTACLENQIDLGTIVGNVKLNGKYPQCCVSK